MVDRVAQLGYDRVVEHETPTFELRQVEHITYRVVEAGGSFTARQETGRYYTVQRKWWVPNGEPTRRERFHDSDLNINTPDDSVPGIPGAVYAIHRIPHWLPRKAVWRDLPVVTAAEAAQDSIS